MKDLFRVLSIGMAVCTIECSAQTVSGNVGGYRCVDLGLGSGLKWATCNIGASSPTEYGDFFAWGETSPKEEYSGSTYALGVANKYGWIEKYLKYNLDDDYGYVDGKTVLEAADDAATANWGKQWRMPTNTEFKELINGCSWVWTSDFNGSGIAGRIGTSKTNGNTIFLPAGGSYDGTAHDYAGDTGYYWSSSLTENSDYASDMYFMKENMNCFYSNRDYGKTVRAVTKATVTGISNNISQEISVVAENGALKITGVQAYDEVSMFDMNGKLIATSKADESGYASVALGGTKGVFVVTVGGLSAKVIIK